MASLLIEELLQPLVEIAESDGEQPAAAPKHESCKITWELALAYAKYLPSSLNLGASVPKLLVATEIVVVVHPSRSYTRIADGDVICIINIGSISRIWGQIVRDSATSLSSAEFEQGGGTATGGHSLACVENVDPITAHIGFNCRYIPAINANPCSENRTRS